MRTIALAAAWTLLTALSGRAAVLHVCPNGSGDYPTIQSAVDAASNGDTIELCSGTFTGPGNMDLDFGDKGLTLQAPSGPGATLIDLLYVPEGGEESEAHFGVVMGRGTTRIAGVAFRGGRNFDLPTYTWGDGGTIRCLGGDLTLDHVSISGFHPWDAVNGGGVYVESGSLTASDCEFEGNHAMDEGGAVYGQQSWLVLERCVLRGNSGCDWGAVSLDGGLIEDCVFESNGGCYGGEDPGGLAIHVLGGDVTVRGCRVADADDLVGAGISSRCGANTLIESCTFEGCTSFAGPCVLMCGGTVRNCTFRGNYAYGREPPDLMCRQTTLVEGCVFEGSGGSYGDLGIGCLDVLDGATTVRNCTFVGAQGRSAIRVRAGASLVLDATILAFGDSPGPALLCVDDPPQVTVSCTDIFGNTGGDWAGCAVPYWGSSGNLSEDPRFCDRGGGDFSLRADSPCVPRPGGCGLVGALPVGCGTTALQPSSWGQVKALYR